jgi:hypothetical protein
MVIAHCSRVSGVQQCPNVKPFRVSFFRGITIVARDTTTEEREARVEKAEKGARVEKAERGARVEKDTIATAMMILLPTRYTTTRIIARIPA